MCVGYRKSSRIVLRSASAEMAASTCVSLMIMNGTMSVIVIVILSVVVMVMVITVDFAAIGCLGQLAAQVRCYERRDAGISSSRTDRDPLLREDG